MGTRNRRLERRDERVARTRELVEAGYTNVQIAAELGIDPTTVSRYVRSMGYGDRRMKGNRVHKQVSEEQLAMIERFLDDGASMSEACRSAGVDVYTGRRHFPGRSWTRQQAAAHAGMVSKMFRDHRNLRTAYHQIGGAW